VNSSGPFTFTEKANGIIRLRALEPEDIELLYSWENNPDTWKASNTLVPVSRFILRQFLENATRDIFEVHQLRLMIELVQTSKPIGTIELFEFDPFHLRAGVGIIIVETSERRKGYAEQSLHLLLDYTFNTLCLHQIYCNIKKDNTPSLQLFKKIGFRVVGVKEQWVRNAEGWEDEYLLQLINPFQAI